MMLTASDPAFQRFFRITMSDYIKVWQLTPDTILKRPRIANQRQAEGRFVPSRGIPSYTEGLARFHLWHGLAGSGVSSYSVVPRDRSDRE